jgi:hypothetical protein
LFVYPTLTFFLDFHWLVAAIMDFFKQLGFGNLRCLTFELAYVNVKKGENFYESILNVLIPKGIRFLLELDDKSFFKKFAIYLPFNLTFRDHT